jgi:hypothetical protein
MRFFRAFSSVVRQMPGWCPQRRGTARTLPNLFVALCIFCVLQCIFCVVLCDVCFVTFPVLFVCIYVLDNCHRVATQLQLTNISYHISYIIPYHIIYHTISYIISYHISYHIISYHIIYHIVSYHTIYENLQTNINKNIGEERLDNKHIEEDYKLPFEIISKLQVKRAGAKEYKQHGVTLPNSIDVILL